jgi:hypothetical protein
VVTRHAKREILDRADTFRDAARQIALQLPGPVRVIPAKAPDLACDASNRHCQRQRRSQRAELEP